MNITNLNIIIIFYISIDYSIIIRNNPYTICICIIHDEITLFYFFFMELIIQAWFGLWQAKRVMLNSKYLIGLLNGNVIVKTIVMLS